MQKQVLAVYGSLRRDEYNHGDLGAVGRCLGTKVLRGARMYDLGSYPAVVLTGEQRDRVVAELYELDMAKAEAFRCAAQIRAMELGAGYEERTVNIDGTIATIYVFSESPRPRREVAGGDWSAYQRARRNN